jgi:hypothetical protein
MTLLCRVRGSCARVSHVASQFFHTALRAFTLAHMFGGRWGAASITAFAALIATHQPAISVAIEANEVPVVAILLDSREIVSERARLNRLAYELPSTPNLMVCVLQSTWCHRFDARDSKNRLSEIQNALAIIERKAPRGDERPSTDDFYRVLNNDVSTAFKEFWNDRGGIADDERYRQIWVVLVTPTIYFSMPQVAGLGYSLHDNRVPDVCFPQSIRSADFGPEARLRIIVAVPEGKKAYPDSALHVLSKIAAGTRRLDGVYQVVLDCPTQTDNMRNWMTGRSVAVDPDSTCMIHGGSRWAANKPENLSCATGKTSPRPLLEQVTNGPTAVAAVPQATPPTPPTTPPAPSVSPQIGPQPMPAPAPPSPGGTPAQKSPPVSAPVPAQQKAPQVATPGNVAPSTPGRSDPSANVPGTPTPREQSPAPQQPRPVERPRRPGPEPSTVTALADTHPEPELGGTAVKRSLRQQPEGAGPIVIEFTGSTGGLDVGIRLVATADATTVGSTSTRRLTVTSPIRPGVYRIVLAARPHDPSCAGGLSIRGAVTAGGKTVAPIAIAVDLEAASCPREAVATVVGTLEVK